MLTRDFDFDLPEASIAQEPLERGQSRLLALAESASRRHRSIADLPDLLTPGDLLVLNDTRVLPARLFGRRQVGGGRVEILLAERLEPRRWEALLRPGRRARPGTSIDFAEGFSAEVEAKGEDGRFRLLFSDDVEPRLESLGHIPLPPYIKRPDEASDRERYQTVYASKPGAIAAPTAGLHFTEALLGELADRGIEHTHVTLHVGLGTFKPVTATLVHEHEMDGERYEIPESAATAIRQTRSDGGRIVAVGTTVVRTLESAARETGEINAGNARTELFITPGFRFRAVDLLLTNFHLPRSTLLMLVCAFAGQERVLDAYREAVEEGYRFYSYGDAMLLDRRS